MAARAEAASANPALSFIRNPYASEVSGTRSAHSSPDAAISSTSASASRVRMPSSASASARRVGACSMSRRAPSF